MVNEGRSKSAAEQPQDDLRPLVGDREGLDAQLLLDLQGLQPGALLGEIRINEGAETLGHRVGDGLGEGREELDVLGIGAERAERLADDQFLGLDRGEEREGARGRGDARG